jgi:AraC family transcriptional regulator
LDESNVSEHSYTGAVVGVRGFAGVVATRIMHPPRQRIAAHGHDHPVLALYRAGAYRETGEEGALLLDGPSVVFHPAGAAHADEVGEAGLETLSLAFDPSWLDGEARAALPRRSLWRAGGVAACAGRTLARCWLSPAATEATLRRATARFALLLFARDAAPPARPAWLDHIDAALAHEVRSARALAAELSRHPAWIARAYRAWRGEGLRETLRRRRVERATTLLRASAQPLAAIAVECGFSDQSHMNRCFSAVLARTPLDVRREARLLASLA